MTIQEFDTGNPDYYDYDTEREKLKSIRTIADEIRYPYEDFNEFQSLTKKHINQLLGMSELTLKAFLVFVVDNTFSNRVEESSECYFITKNNNQSFAFSSDREYHSCYLDEVRCQLIVVEKSQKYSCETLLHPKLVIEHFLDDHFDDFKKKEGKIKRQIDFRNHSL